MDVEAVMTCVEEGLHVFGAPIAVHIRPIGSPAVPKLLGLCCVPGCGCTQFVWDADPRACR